MVAPSADVPFSHYLSTNDPPNAQVLEDIQFYISKPREELDGVNREIHELERRLTSLRSRSEALRETIKKYDGICSRIRVLPDDILSEIFVRCLPDDRFPVFHVSDAPFLLMVVCRRWRDLALQTPSLWAKFHVVTNMCDTGSMSFLSPSASSQLKATAERQAATIRMCVARSGTLPLSFSLNDNSTYPPNDPSPVIDLIGALLPRLGGIRWRTWVFFQKYIESQAANSFPVLEKITLRWPGFDAFDAADPPAYLLAPKLHDVYIHGFNASPSLLPLKWGQLTRLALPGTDRVTPHAELLELLKICSKLEEGIFFVSGEETKECCVSQGIPIPDCHDNSHSSPQPQRNSNSVALPRLRHLDITHSDCIGGLLARLHLPRLTKLSLRGDRSESHMGFHVACLPTLLDRNEECLSSLEELVVRPGVYFPPILIGCLKRLAGLRALVLVDKNGSSVYHPGTEKDIREEFNEDMLVRMTPILPILGDLDPQRDLLHPATPPCLCPLLERFEFREGINYKANRHLTLNTLVPFVSGKWEASLRYPGRISALKHITVPSRNLPDESVKKALKRWRKEGLVVEFAHPSLEPKTLPRPFDEAWRDPIPNVAYW